MSADPAFLLLLALKMAATAAVVVTASLIAERLSALLGAMVATLPIAAGPAYILLAIDHERQFIADSTVSSLAAHAATGMFGMAYVFAAQRFSFPLAIVIAVATWFSSALVIQAVPWSFAGAIALCAATYAVCVVLARGYLHARVPPIMRRWYDVPLRAALVAVLVGVVVELGANAGPRLTGMFAIFPIVMLSLMLILHPRIGGVATAAIIANTMWGLVGFASAIATLHLAVVPLGAPLALTLALAVSVAINVVIIVVRRRGKTIPAARAAPISRRASPSA